MKLQISTHTSMQGAITVPGDKSISHRAVLLGAISKGRSEVRGFLPATDCLATVRCLRELGVQIDEVSATHLTVQGRGLTGLVEPDNVLDCGGSGTTMRLLAGILASYRFLSILTGNAQLRSRPMGRIVSPLRTMGAYVLARDNGRLPPLCIRGGTLEGMDYTLPVASAQVKSAILLAGLSALTPTTVREPSPSRDHTERMLSARGIDITSKGDGIITLRPGRELAPIDVLVPGDLSSAAFFLVAACVVPNSEILIRSVGTNPSRTGILDALWAMGADIKLENQREIGGESVSDLFVRTSSLKSTEVSGRMIPRLIDELPILALAATQAHGVTTVRDAAELRIKETNRIETTVRELQKLGAKIEAQQDGFSVEGPTPLQGTEVDSHGDHRLAMTLAIAGLIASGTTVVHGSECIADSFPGFEDVLRSLTNGQVPDQPRGQE